MLKDNRFYIYLHIKSTNGEPFYVGKGMGNRKIEKRGRTKYWHNVVNKYGYEVILLEDNLTNEEAYKKETYWIERIGRKDIGLGPLLNFTNGGEGMIGYKHTDYAKNKISESNRNRKYSDETIDKLKNNCKNFGSKNGMYGSNRTMDENPNSKIVINLETGIYHYSLKEVSIVYNLNYVTLVKKLSGNRKNNTQFIYV